eukprot:2306583-Prymnesium_polylepis.1
MDGAVSGFNGLGGQWFQWAVSGFSGRSVVSMGGQWFQWARGARTAAKLVHNGAARGSMGRGTVGAARAGRLEMLSGAGGHDQAAGVAAYLPPAGVAA